MTAYLLLVHVLNLLAPALWVAVVVVSLSRWLPGFSKGRPVVSGWVKQCLMGVSVNVAVLVGGLALFGQDGKMLTYVLLVVASALCQGILLRAWQR